MKILWIVNTIFPYPAKQIGQVKNVFGGWLNGLANELIKEENIDLAIATVYNGKTIKIFNDGKIMYYLIPGAPAMKYNKILEKYWRIINNEFVPDLVHIHGTEFAHGLAFRKACPEVKIVTSIQGLVSICEKVYYGNIKIKEILKNITFRDILKHDTIFQAKKKFENRGKNEIKLIKGSNAIIGRTTWDYANTKALNLDEKYYIGNEILRSNFYDKEWKIENVEKHTIFCSQANYPIKGLHYMLEALYILKQIYSDVKLYIAGNNILDTTTLSKKIKKNGYAKYIKTLIKKYELDNNIIFTGLLDENQMIEKLLKTNVFVLPSAIENSSNSLGEAMLLGMPCVASNTGGTMDILEHKKEGLLYPYTEPTILAEYISRYFKESKLCEEYGKNARITALQRHNPEKNVKEVIKIYKKVLGD